MFDVDTIAKVCHETNAAYCRATGDFSQPSWDDAPDWQKDSAREGVKFHMGDPNASPSASHESWLAQKERDGWTFGEVKDPVAKTHYCIVPFDRLPMEQQIKDVLFKSIVHSMYWYPAHGN